MDGCCAKWIKGGMTLNPFTSIRRWRSFLFSFRATVLAYRILERLTNYRFERRRFFRRHGYPLNLSQPTTFSEKIVWKKLNDRNPLLPLVADKYSVRKYVADRLGPTLASKVLIPLLYYDSDPSAIPFENLPPEYIIKATHGSGWNIIKTAETELDRDAVIAQLRKWLRLVHGTFGHQWAYERIPPAFVIEPLLRDENGDIPEDYKFFMINGNCRLIQVDLQRFKDHKRSLFDENWNYLDASLKCPKGPPLPRPTMLEDMLDLARTLAAPFDMVRVDLYCCNSNVYFGELTHYPESGTGRFTPRELDHQLGMHWKLRKRYWIDC